MSADHVDTTGTPIARAGFIGTDGTAMFAWHHPACAATPRSAGIVLCPPLGYEYLSAYRTWRLLAERLASRGFDVLRFDYEGTGNSDDDPGDQGPAQIERWVQNIDRAIRELRALAAPAAVALVGLRLGALLALKAAASRDDVDRLVLWGGFSSGRTCVRELRALARLSQQDHAQDDADARDVNAAGYFFPQETLEALSHWTVTEVKNAPANDVLLIDRSDRPVDSAFAHHLKGLVPNVTMVQREGTTEMLAPPHRAKLPESILTTLVDWFDTWRPSTIARAGESNAAEGALRLSHATRGGCERPVRFGPDGRLFGMLTEPVRDSQLPSVILLTTGVEHHVGPHRLYVPLSRDWAARGHVVLRYDVGGIGDSLAPPGGQENTSYPSNLLDDAAEAIAFTRRTAPDRPVILAGLCSGGWAAFLAARERLDVDAFVAVNPPLYLRDPDAGAAWRAEIEELERYQQLSRDPAKWIRALRQPTSIGNVARIATLALRRGTAAWVGRTPGDGLAGDLARIAERRVDALFVFSARDKGLEYFQEFGATASQRDQLHRHIRHVVVDGAGHSFRPRHAQETLRKLLIEFVAARSR